VLLDLLRLQLLQPLLLQQHMGEVIAGVVAWDSCLG
jgi:hypothetical protein